VVLWVRSYRAYTGSYHAIGDSLYFAEHDHGFVRFARIDSGDMSSVYQSTYEAPAHRRQFGKLRTPWLGDETPGETPLWDESFVDPSPFLWRHFGLVVGRGQMPAPSST
jgi:hypothetical protein